MKLFWEQILRASRLLNIIAGICLASIIILTVADVILRYFRRPILGTYEIVGFLGALVIGLAIPYTSLIRGQIYVDIMTAKLSRRGRDVVNIITRCLAMALFLLVGLGLMQIGRDLYRTGEVSATLQLPFYPLVFGLGLSCFLECFVLAYDIWKIRRGLYE